MTLSNNEQVNVAIGDNASVIANPGEFILPYSGCQILKLL